MEQIVPQSLNCYIVLFPVSSIRKNKIQGYIPSKEDSVQNYLLPSSINTVSVLYALNSVSIKHTVPILFLYSGQCLKHTWYLFYSLDNVFKNTTLFLSFGGQYLIFYALNGVSKNDCYSHAIISYVSNQCIYSRRLSQTASKSTSHHHQGYAL